MESKDVIIEAFGRIRGLLATCLDGLNAEQIAHRPGEEMNSIAWLAWHLTRVQDNHVSSLAGRDQAWVADGWHAKFGRPADTRDTGHGHMPEQVASISPSDPKLLVDYHEAVYQRSLAYLGSLTPAALDTVVDDPRFNPPPTVGARLVSVIADNLQHAGQMNYVRGWIENRRWLGV